MEVKTSYNPVSDIAPVEQFGFVNLVESLANGFIPTEISNTEDSYNDIDDPSLIVGKPRDTFEAITMMEQVKSQATKE